jgi:hypothetical protein
MCLLFNKVKRNLKFVLTPADALFNDMNRVTATAKQNETRTANGVEAKSHLGFRVGSLAAGINAWQAKNPGCSKSWMGREAVSEYLAKRVGKRAMNGARRAA